MLIHIGGHAHEAALEIPVGIGTDAADLQLLLDLVDQQIAQGPCAGELNIPMSIFLL